MPSRSMPSRIQRLASRKRQSSTVSFFVCALPASAAVSTHTQCSRIFLNHYRFAHRLQPYRQAMPWATRVSSVDTPMQRCCPFFPRFLPNKPITAHPCPYLWTRSRPRRPLLVGGRIARRGRLAGVAVHARPCRDPLDGGLIAGELREGIGVIGIVDKGEPKPSSCLLPE